MTHLHDRCWGIGLETERPNEFHKDARSKSGQVAARLMYALFVLVSILPHHRHDGCMPAGVPVP